MPISSVGNPTIRRMRRLRKRAWRERRGQTLLEGRRTVATALRAGIALPEVLHLADRSQDDVVAAAKVAGSRIHAVTAEVMAHLTDAATAPSIVAIGPVVQSSLEQLAGASTIVLAEVRDPATVGGLIATAAAAGLSGVVVCTGSADPYAPRVIRASGGAHYRLRVVHGIEASGAIAALGGGVRTLSLGADGPAPWDVALKGPMVLVVGGAEGDERVSVPSIGGGEPPLTAAVAVVLYEWRRQEGDSP